MEGLTHSSSQWAAISREHSSADTWTAYQLVALDERELARLNELNYRCRQEDCGGYVEFMFSVSRRASRTQKASEARIYICRAHAHEFALRNGLEAPGAE